MSRRLRALGCCLVAAVHSLAAAGVASAAPPPPSLDEAARAADSADPLQGVGKLLAEGRNEEARTRLRAAVKAARDRADARGEAVALLLLGIADVAAEDAVAAKADLEQSAAGMNALGDRLGAWMATWSLAEVARREGQFDTAVAHTERTLELLSEAEASPQPFSLQTLESLAEPLGLPALGPLLAHPALAKPVLLRLLEAISRDSYAAALIDVDRLAEAEAELTRAAAASQLFGGLFDASVATHLGDLRRRQWKLDTAEESYRRALAAVVDLPPMPFGDRWLEVGILGKLAEVALLDGRLDDALAWNERALGLVRSGGDLRREAAVLDERANLLLRGDRLAPAEKAFGEALAVAERSTDVYRQASIHADRGFLHLVGGNYQQAAADLRTAIELFAKLGRPDAEASTWVVLAEVYTLLDLQGDALAAAERARALAAASGFRPARALSDLLTSAIAGEGALTEDLDRSLQEVLDLPEASALLLDADLLSLLRGMLGPTAGAAGTARQPNLVAAESSTLPTIAAFAQFLRGKLAFQAGDLVTARQLWNRSLEKTSSKDLRAGFLAAIGVTYWREGNAGEAARYFTQAVEALELAVEDLRVEEMLAGYLGSERRFYFDVLVHVLVQQGRLEEAFEVTERARARSFLQLVGNRRLRAPAADAVLVHEAEALRTQVLDWERQALFALPAERKRLQADLRQARDRQQEILLRLKVAAPEYASLTKVETLGLPAVRAQLPPDTTLISYFVSPLGTHAWVLDQTTFEHLSLPLDRPALQRAVCWAQGLGPRAGARGAVALDRRCPGEPATAEELYSELITPLAGSIHQPRILLVPHGVLHYVPFAALRNPRTGRYLIEDHTLVYAPSATALQFLRGKETPVTGGALVLGDPQTQDPDLDRLPAAAGEALGVARKLDTTAVLGTRAKESLLYHLDGKVDLLHIAAHGFYDSASPRFSHLALAPDDGEDGHLEVHEILAELDLSGVNLVVLSACQTAVGERSGGDEIVGLTRALLYAGTPGVVSTLWDIDDDAAMALMEELYDRLQAGVGAADALRKAQLALLRSPRYHDPRFWAAFSLTGDPQGRWSAPIRKGSGAKRPGHRARPPHKATPPRARDVGHATESLTSPDAIRRAYDSASELLRLGRLAEARELVRRAMRAWPQVWTDHHPDDHEMLGLRYLEARILARSGKPQEAANELERVVEDAARKAQYPTGPNYRAWHILAAEELIEIYTLGCDRAGLPGALERAIRSEAGLLTDSPFGLNDDFLRSTLADLPQGSRLFSPLLQCGNALPEVAPLTLERVLLRREGWRFRQRLRLAAGAEDDDVHRAMRSLTATRRLQAQLQLRVHDDRLREELGRLSIPQNLSPPDGADPFTVAWVQLSFAAATLESNVVDWLSDQRRGERGALDGSLVTAARGALPADAALVVVLELPDDAGHPTAGRPTEGALAFVVDRQQGVSYRRLEEAVPAGASLLSAISSLSSRGTRRTVSPADDQQWEAHLRAAGKALLDPLDPLLDGKDKLFLLTDGRFRLLPWQALVDRQGRLLGDRATVRHVQSVSDLLPPAAGSGSPGEEIVLFGPAYDELEPQTLAVPLASRAIPEQFRPLPGVAPEVQAVRDAVRGEALRVRALEGAEATEAAAWRLRRPRALHFAGHGFRVPLAAIGFATEASVGGAHNFRWPFELNSPWGGARYRTGIALSDANRGRPLDGPDGLLTAAEVADLDLLGTRLVVLSACETGSPVDEDATGAYDLALAFRLAGARSVVASLWRVDDRATVLFMTHFYAALVSGGSVVEAARAARDAVRQTPELSHPFFWAGFEVFGEDLAL